MQGVRQRRNLGHRCSVVPDGSETGGGGPRHPDQLTNPGKGGIADPTPEGGTKPQA